MRGGSREEARVESGAEHSSEVLCPDTVSGHLVSIEQQHGNIVAVAPFKGVVGRDVDLGEHEGAALTKFGYDHLHLVAEMATGSGVQGEFHTRAKPPPSYGRADAWSVWLPMARAASRGDGDAIMGRPTTR